MIFLAISLLATYLLIFHFPFHPTWIEVALSFEHHLTDRAILHGNNPLLISSMKILMDSTGLDYRLILATFMVIGLWLSMKSAHLIVKNYSSQATALLIPSVFLLFPRQFEYLLLKEFRCFTVALAVYLLHCLIQLFQTHRGLLKVTILIGLAATYYTYFLSFLLILLIYILRNFSEQKFKCIALIVPVLIYELIGATLLTGNSAFELPRLSAAHFYGAELDAIWGYRNHFWEAFWGRNAYLWPLFAALSSVPIALLLRSQRIESSQKIVLSTALIIGVANFIFFPFAHPSRFFIFFAIQAISIILIFPHLRRTHQKIMTAALLMSFIFNASLVGADLKFHPYQSERGECQSELTKVYFEERHSIDEKANSHLIFPKEFIMISSLIAFDFPNHFNTTYFEIKSGKYLTPTSHQLKSPSFQKNETVQKYDLGHPTNIDIGLFFDAYQESEILDLLTIQLDIPEDSYHSPNIGRDFKSLCENKKNPR